MTDMPELKSCPLMPYIEKTDTCWNWTGAKNNRGYGHCKGGLAHRVMYEKHKGAIDEGMTIDHICRNTSCVNPDHLRQMTQYDNNMAGESRTAINKRKTHCINGHPLEGKHIKIRKRKDGVSRKCMLCEKIYKKKRRQNGKR